MVPSKHLLNNLETRELGEQMRSKGDDAAYTYTQDMLSTLSKMKEDAEHINELNIYLKELEAKDYRQSSSIHAPEAIRFSREILKASPWVLETLKNGLALETTGPVPPYEEPNNKSCTEQLPVMREKFCIWQKEGKIEQVYKKPRIVNPLSLVSKLTGEAQVMKHRPVIDQSRHVNLYIPKIKTKLNDLPFFEPFFEKNMYATTYDMEGMFHQLRLTRSTSELFGCALEQEDKTVKFYRFCVLMFGNKDAVRIMTKLMLPAINLFRDMGIKTGVYIDDGMIVNISPCVLKAETHFVLTILGLAGWRLNTEKTVKVPTQTPLYQGVFIDFKKLEYTLPLWKVKETIKRLEELMDKVRKHELIPARTVSKAMGKCIAAKRSHGPGVQIGLRHTQHMLGKQTCWRGPEEEPNWDILVKLDKQSLDEMEYVKKLLQGMNGYLIPLHREVQIYEKDGVSFRTIETFRPEEQSRVFCSDASDKYAFVFEADNFNIVEEFAFSEEDIRTGSGHRELLAVAKTLKKHKHGLVGSGTRFYWITDSKNVYHFLKRGSRKREVQQTILAIKKWEAELGIRIIPIWKPRTTNELVMADIGSKMYQSTDEWAIDHTTFQKIQKFAGMKVTIDAFATSANKMVDRFYSKYPQIGSLGLDFFAQNLRHEEVYWITPPVTKVLDAINHVLHAEDMVVAFISFPEWKNANYWPMIIRGQFYAP